MELGISLMDPFVVEQANKQIEKIQPVVTAHKGGVEIVEATSEKLVIGLKGHCAGCALAPITFGKVLDKYLREALPQLKEISYIELK